MNRTRRRKGSNVGIRDTPPIDRLSDLPDSILCHILSFLETEDSVRTSILATRWREDHVYFHKYRLKIDTPALVYLQVHDRVTEHIESGMMTSLTEASISLWNDEEKGDDYAYSQSVLEFLSRLCNVKRLKLDLQGLTEIIDSIATVSFHNLAELDLTADGLFLSKFLKNADNLEILKFFEIGDEGHRAWAEPEQVPTCLSSHLRTVKMFCVATSRDFEIVRYVLRNALILGRMEISCCEDFEGKKWPIEEMSKMERGSEACELAFV